MIKHLSFDVWKTLFGGNKTFSEQRVRCIADYTGLLPATVLAAVKRTKEFYDSGAEAHGLADSMEGVYGYLLTELGKPDLDWRPLCGKVQDLFLTYPPEILFTAFDTLSHLRSRGFTTSIASNTVLISGRTTQKLLRQHLGPWDFMVFSDLVGTAKPSPQFFDIVAAGARTVGAQPHEVLHIGDSAVCDGAAAKFGMSSHIITGPKDLGSVLAVLK